VGVLAAVTGFVSGNVLDFNEAQLTIALLCVCLVLAWASRPLRGR
jgi:hypothetical protein